MLRCSASPSSGVIRINARRGEGGTGGAEANRTPVSVSPACLGVDWNDIISQEVQGAAGLCWFRLTADTKIKV